MEVEHELKCHPIYFERIVSGQKTFEVRKNDRNFQVNDILILKEYDPELNNEHYYPTNIYTAKIVYIETYAQQEGYVVLGIVGKK
jgi:ASC-1-like (ASCH) protein